MQAPPWLLLDQVLCHEIKFKAKWTRMRSRPMEIWIDRIDLVVRIDTEASEAGAGWQQHSRKRVSIPLLSGHNWGFVHAIVEGMLVHIGAIHVRAICAGVEINTTLRDLNIGSVDPLWQPAPLNKTRTRDKRERSVTVFKEISVGAMSLELSCSDAGAGDGGQMAQTFAVTVSGVRIRAEVTRLIAKAAFVRGALQTLIGQVNVSVNPEQVLLMKEIIARLAEVKSRISDFGVEQASLAAAALQVTSPRRVSGLFRRKNKASTDSLAATAAASAVAAVFGRPDLSLHTRVGIVAIECRTAAVATATVEPGKVGANRHMQPEEQLLGLIIVSDVIIHIETAIRAPADAMAQARPDVPFYAFHADWLAGALRRQYAPSGAGEVGVHTM